MKALVLEIKDGKAAVLREDGIVVTTTQPCSVGETIEVADRVPASFARRRGRAMRAVAAALIVLLITGSSFGYMTVSASSYVSIDAGEASVELAVNRFGRVIDVRPTDDGSSALAEDLRREVRHKRFGDASGMVVERFERDGFIGSGEEIVAGFAGNDRQRERLSGEFEERFRGGERSFVMMDVSPEERREAMENMKSPGRFVFERGGGPGGQMPPEGPGGQMPPKGPGDVPPPPAM